MPLVKQGWRYGHLMKAVSLSAYEGLIAPYFMSQTDGKVHCAEALCCGGSKVVSFKPQRGQVPKTSLP